MPHKYNKQDENNKIGKGFTDSPNSSQKDDADFTGGQTMDKETDTLRLKLIYEKLPDHCIQFFFLS